MQQGRDASRPWSSAAALVVPGCGGDAREGVPFESLSGVPGMRVEAALTFSADEIAQRFPQGAFPPAADIADALTVASRSGSLDLARQGRPSRRCVRGGEFRPEPLFVSKESTASSMVLYARAESGRVYRFRMNTAYVIASHRIDALDGPSDDAVREIVDEVQEQTGEEPRARSELAC